MRVRIYGNVAPDQSLFICPINLKCAVCTCTVLHHVPLKNPTNPSILLFFPLLHSGMFTVFAPTDEAFEHELRYPNEAPLKEKMQFHVGRGLVQSKARAKPNQLSLVRI